jgi:hypothetical protein
MLVLEVEGVLLVRWGWGRWGVLQHFDILRLYCLHYCPNCLYCLHA